MSEARLEKVLRESLQREAPPADFAAKILAKTVGQVDNLRTNFQLVQPDNVRPFPERPKSWIRKPITLALAATLAAIAIVPAVVMDYQRREEQARGLKAKQDLMLALAITRDQFRQAKEKVQRTTVLRSTGNTQ